MIFPHNTNYDISKEGLVTNIKTGHILRPVEKKSGYFEIRLSKSGKNRTYSVHRLVYSTFKGIPRGLHINHINGIRHDNRLANLEAVTPEENNRNRIFLCRGENVNTSKLTEVKVMEIRKAKSEGARTTDLMEKYHVSKTAINRVASGFNWKHLEVLPVDKTLWGDPRKTGVMSRKTTEEKYGKDYFSKIAKGMKFKKHCETCTCEGLK